LTVNIGPATAEALEHVVEREGVTITEALRRLVGYGFVLYKTIKTDNKDVLIRSGNETQQVLIP
jgi:predicted transcriptional regulator